jgi:transcriptional regulator with XRE-family HTH domain
MYIYLRMAHHPSPPGFSCRLRHLRKLAGLSLQQASALASRAITLASSIKRNPKANPTVGTVRGLALILVQRD